MKWRLYLLSAVLFCSCGGNYDKSDSHSQKETNYQHDRYMDSIKEAKTNEVRVQQEKAEREIADRKWEEAIKNIPKEVKAKREAEMAEEDMMEPDQLEELYRVFINNYVFIYNVEKKYTDDYKPYISLTVENRTKFKITSMKFYTSKNSYMSIGSTVIVKKTILPRSKAEFSFAILEAGDNNKISLHSVIRDNGTIYRY